MARLDALELELLRIEVKRLRENLVAADEENERLQNEGKGRGRWGGTAHRMRGGDDWSQAPAPANCDGCDADVSSYAGSEDDRSHAPVQSSYDDWEMDAPREFKREGEDGLYTPLFCRSCDLPKLCMKRGHADRGCDWSCLEFTCGC